MIIFTKQHKPLTIKLMFSCMLMSLVMIVVVPHVIEIFNYRLGIINPVISVYIGAISLVLGVLSYVVALVGLVFSVLERK